MITAQDLVTDLGRAYREGRLDRRMRVYIAPKVLIIDEMGYPPLDDLGATVFFQLVSACYERGSIILTSNESYGEWASIFGDPIIATASSIGCCITPQPSTSAGRATGSRSAARLA